MKNAFTIQDFYCKIVTESMGSVKFVMQQDSLISVHAYYDGLTKNDKQIADYVLKHGSEVHDMTIGELAENCNTSIASVSRFVKRIGYNSYREFLLDLPRVTPTYGDALSGLSSGDKPEEITSKTFDGAMMALTSTRSMLTDEKLQQAAEMLLAPKHLCFFGLGGSSVVALSGYHKFLRTNLDCNYHPDYDIQLMQAIKMNKNDVAIVVSHSGKNQQTLLLAKEMKKRGVPIIAITSYPNSQLAEMADLALISVAEEINYRSESMSSLIAQITIMDSLFSIAAVQNTEATEGIVQNVRQIMDETRKKS